MSMLMTVDLVRDSDIRPRRLTGVLENSLPNETLFYVPGKDLAVCVNESAKAIWDLCDGSRNLVEMAQAIGLSIGLTDPTEPPALLADVRTAVLELRALGLLEPG
jgi:hypothetical protein